MDSRCPEHSMGKPGCLCIPCHRPAAQHCTKTSVSSMQDNSDCPRLADKIVVWGPSGDVSGHFKKTTTHMHSAQTTTEQPLPYQPNIREPPSLVSRSSAVQEHGLTAEVTERIETLNKIHLHFQLHRFPTMVYKETGGLQECFYKGTSTTSSGIYLMT